MSFRFKKIAAVGALIGAIALAGCDQKRKTLTTSKWV